MTDSTPLGRITSTLEAAGYRCITNGLRVGNLTFEFPAAFVKEQSSSDLILVADSADEPEDALSRKVNGVARALDITQSTRSLTLVVTGPRPTDAALESLGRVCRVLPTGNISGVEGDTLLKNWLAVLLPLSLPMEEATATNPLASVRTAARRLDDTTQRLIEAASQGPAAVKMALYATIDAAARLDKEQRG
jgi:hypothetical protein